MLTVNKMIIVTDDSDLPICDAEVKAMSYSMSIASVFSNSNGKAVVKRNIQKVKWVSVQKQGYKSADISISGEWPLLVQLRKQ